MEKRERASWRRLSDRCPPVQKTAHIPPDKFRYLWDLFNIADEDGSGEYIGSLVGALPKSRTVGMARSRHVT